MAEFGEEDLSGSTFDRTDLSGSTFRAASLSNVTIRGTDLHHVKMTGVELWDVDISGEVKDLRSGDQAPADPDTWLPPEEDLRPVVSAAP